MSGTRTIHLVCDGCGKPWKVQPVSSKIHQEGPDGLNDQRRDAAEAGWETRVMPGGHDYCGGCATKR